MLLLVWEFISYKFLCNLPIKCNEITILRLAGWLVATTCCSSNKYQIKFQFKNLLHKKQLGSPFSRLSMAKNNQFECSIEGFIIEIN